MLTITSGILVTVHLLRRRPVSWLASSGHAALALACLVLVGIGVLPFHAEAARHLALVAFVFLLAASISGLYPAWHRIKRQRASFEVLFIHAAIGILAFGLSLALAF